MPNVDESRIRAFQTATEFGRWLARNHGEPEIWLQIFKKDSGRPTVNLSEAVTEALCWGWIDGMSKSRDAQSFLQRFCPRRKGSVWSMVNRRDAEALIAAGRMQRPGMAAIDEAKSNGRWENAYLGASEASTPQDFLDALDAEPVARATFDTLNAANRYAIYFRLQTAPSPRSRENRKAALLDKLRQGVTTL